MHDRRMLALTICATVAAFVAAMMANTSIAGAQVASPAADESTGTDLPHLAHINAGSCGELSHIVFKLDDVAAVSSEATETAGSDAAASPAVATNSESGAGTKLSTTTVNVSLDDLLAEDHAINIHESIQAVDTYVACGDIAGTPTDGELEIEMVEQNGSGLSGTATLRDNGDGTTTVTIVLAQAEPSPGGTPEATPVS